MAEKIFDKTKLNVNFEQATTRENIVSGENICTSFGKLSKIVDDLSETAFSGNATTVGNHTVESNVPADAVFTDTVYEHPTLEAKTGSPTENQTPGFGETFEVSQTITNDTGHVTEINTRTVLIPSTEMSGATSSKSGKTGLVPPPAAGQENAFLRGDGMWAIPEGTGTGGGGTSSSDTKVTQSGTTESNYRPIVLGYTQSTNVDELTDTVTSNVFVSKSIYAKASTGTLYASEFSGSGASLTSLNADNISSGTLSSDRLPTVPITKGGTGATTAKAAQYNLLNDMYESETDVGDTTPMVCRYAEPSETNGTLFTKPASLLWDYIKKKSDSEYLISESGRVYSGSDQTGWHKAAECTFTSETGQRRQATYLVVGNGGTKHVGILSLNVLVNSATTNTLVVDCGWSSRSSSINLSKFVLVTKFNDEDNTVTSELWVNLTSLWHGYRFTKLETGNVSDKSNDTSDWHLCSSTAASESYPTDYDVTTVSEDTSVYLPLSGGDMHESAKIKFPYSAASTDNDRNLTIDSSGIAYNGSVVGNWASSTIRWKADAPNTTESTVLFGIGAYGTTGAFSYMYLGKTYQDTMMRFYPDTKTIHWNAPTSTGYTAIKPGYNSTGNITLTLPSSTGTLALNTAMTAATSSAAGKAGLVPAPAAGKQSSFLRGDGTWATPTDTKVNVTLATTTKAYLLGVSTTPTSTATALTAVSDTGVYLDTTAGKLTATSFSGSGASLTSLNASNISSGTISSARLPTVPATKGGTGKTTLTDSANALINALGTGTSTPTDDDYFISQAVGGGTTDTKYYRRPMSLLYKYIKEKEYGYVYSGSNQTGWHKAAECTFSDTSSSMRQATLLVTGSGDGSAIYGVLRLSLTSKTGSTLGIGSAYAGWVSRTSHIAPTGFVLVTKLADGAITSELWVYISAVYATRKFIILESSERSGVLTNGSWKVCKSTTASESYPEDYDETTVSTDSSYAATATKWETPRNINGMLIDGSANRVNYGTCSTAAATAAKTVACTGFALIPGAEIAVKFTNTNSADSPTLNVNSTGAKAIYYRGAAITTTTQLIANVVYTFRYDGTIWVLNDTSQVYQSVSTTSSFRALMLGTGSHSTAADITTTANGQLYSASGLYVKPSTGTLYATTFSGSGASLTSLNASNVSSGTLSSDRLPTVPITKGGTGATSAKAAQYNLLNDMNESTSDVSDTTVMVCRYSTPSATNGALFTRPVTYLWDYIKGKADDVYYPLNRKTATTAATAGWYRIATSPVGIGRCIGTFTVEGSASGKHTATTFVASNCYGVTSAAGIVVLNTANFGTSASNKAISKVRVVYHSAYSTNYAYVEVYNPNAAAIKITCTMTSNRGWTLTDPNTAGSIPDGYYSKEVTLDDQTVIATKFAGSGASLTSLNASNISSGTLASARLATSGVTSGSYGPSANASPAHSGTFSVPYITVDTYGRVTAASTKTITLPASGNTDVSVKQTESTTANYRPIMLGVTNTTDTTALAATATGQVYATTTMYAQPSTGSIYATKFVGALSGNASSATKVYSTLTNPSTASSYYLPFHTNSSSENKSLLNNDGIRYATQEGTTSAAGIARLCLGNTKVSGTAGNKVGTIALYGTSSGYTHIVPGYNSTGNITLTLPSSTGTLALNTTMTAATSSAAGKAGLVPAPAAGKQTSFLRGDGTWATPTDTKVNVTLATTTKAYLLGVSTAPTSTAAARTAVSDTGVYLDTEAGELTATKFNGQSTAATKAVVKYTELSTTSTDCLIPYFNDSAAATDDYENRKLLCNDVIRINLSSSQVSMVLGINASAGSGINTPGRLGLHNGSGANSFICPSGNTTGSRYHTLPLTDGTIMNSIVLYSGTGAASVTTTETVTNYDTLTVYYTYGGINRVETMLPGQYRQFVIPISPSPSASTNYNSMLTGGLTASSKTVSISHSTTSFSVSSSGSVTTTAVTASSAKITKVVGNKFT